MLLGNYGKSSSEWQGWIEKRGVQSLPIDSIGAGDAVMKSVPRA